MILIIDKSKRERELIQDMLHYIGIPSYAASIDELENEDFSLYRAVLVSSPNRFLDATSIIARIKERDDIPIFALGDTADRKFYDKVFLNNTFSPAIIEEMSLWLTENGRTPIGVFRLAGIDASLDLPTPTMLGRKVGFTKTEAIILRTLIAAYPTPLLTRDVLKFSFRQSRMPEMPSVRTHISVMNRRMMKEFYRELTLSLGGGGYVIATPEIKARLKKDGVLV